MARTALTVQTIVPAGLVVALAAANADGHKFLNRGDEYLEVVNGSAGSIDVTVQTGKTVGGRAVADDAVAVDAGDTAKIGPWDEDIYNQPSGADAGMVYVDFSDVADVTVGAFRLP